MSSHQPDNELPEQTTSSDALRALVLQDEVEILREQIDSLQQALHSENQQRQEIEQELKQINNELSLMKIELHSVLCSQPVSVDEAKELAKTILVSKKPAQASIAQLLSAIYGKTVEAWELHQQPRPRFDRSH